MVTITMCGLCSSTRISMSAGPQSRHDHDLAVRFTVGQQPDRLHAPLQGEALRDARLEGAGMVPREQLSDRLLELVRRVPAIVAQRAPERGAILHQKTVGGNVR